MAAPPIQSYLLGTIFLTFRVLSFLSAVKDYEMFGLPLEHETNASTISKSDLHKQTEDTSLSSGLCPQRS
ncbi:hypothetical protein EYZ11_000412 [Aspergillus tanneri]|nr:hypothetical protein EYZ11_000412 [Aspergillus tanneri]